MTHLDSATLHQPRRTAAGAATPPLHLATTLAELVSRAGSAMADDPSRARHLLAHASALLADSAPAAARPGGGLAPWQARRVADHVRANLDTALRIADLARLVRLSTGHFCRAFKATFDETPHLYLTRMRVLHAQQLMLGTTQPLAQIALDCGMADQAHFSRVFRRATGDSPSAWRRRHHRPN